MRSAIAPSPGFGRSFACDLTGGVVGYRSAKHAFCVDGHTGRQTGADCSATRAADLSASRHVKQTSHAGGKKD